MSESSKEKCIYCLKPIFYVVQKELWLHSTGSHWCGERKQLPATPASRIEPEPARFASVGIPHSQQESVLPPLDDSLEAMVRDFTQIGSRPKSEVRRRILAHFTAREDALQRKIDAALPTMHAVQSHLDELAEGWRTGGIRDLEGKCGIRSNRNMDLLIEVSKAIAALIGEG